MDGELIYTYEFKLRKGEEGPKMMFNFFPRWLLVETLRVTGWTAEKNLDSIQFNRGPVSIGWSCLMFQIKYVREFHGASSFFFQEVLTDVGFSVRHVFVQKAGRFWAAYRVIGFQPGNGWITL